MRFKERSLLEIYFSARVLWKKNQITIYTSDQRAADLEIYEIGKNQI